MCMRRNNRTKICPMVTAKIRSKTKEEVPVIIKVKNQNKLKNEISNMSTKIKYHLPLVGGIACDMKVDAIEKLSNDPDIEYISFDSKVFTLLDVATASIKSNFPREEGFTGEGVTVAVVDTGVAPHADLIKPRNRIIGFKDLVNDKETPYDDNGHGTHVAGIIASNGYSSNGKYAGVAPMANILAVKALDDTGSGSTSDIIEAIQWVIETKDQYNTKILNLSIGSPANNPYYSDPLVEAAEKAVEAGLIVVAAAGNSGPAQKTILSPGTSPKIITVGAVDDNKTPEIDDDTIASFSSRGPTKEGIRKPDLVAPGVDIMSLSNTKLTGYHSLSGTSMATPLVSGAIALLCSKNKDLNPSSVKSLVQSSCIDLNEKYEDQGSGIIDLQKLFQKPINKIPPVENSKSSFIFGDDFIVAILVILLLTRKF